MRLVRLLTALGEIEMNKVAIINCSPREKNSVSNYFMSELKIICQDTIEFKDFYLSNFKRNPMVIYELIEFSKILFVAPLYVDALPGEMVSFMLELEEVIKSKNKHNIKVYSLINCGFIEGTQNVHAIEMLKIFTKKAGLKWGFGVGIGGGEFMKASNSMPLHFFVKKPVYNALLALKNSIINDTTSTEHLLVNAKIPRKMFISMGNGFWNSKSKTNGLSKKNMYNKPFLN